MSGHVKERLASLDALRGLVIAVMMFVNAAGHDGAFPAWVPHRGWNEGRQGLGLADYVFPLFLFIIGAAAHFSAAGSAARGEGLGAVFARQARRAVLLYLLGTLLYCATIGYDVGITWRVLLHWDILPLIAWAGLLAAMMLRAPLAARAAFVVGALVFKWYLLTRVVVPGEAGPVWTPERNAQRWLNGELGWFGVPLTQGLCAASLCVMGAWCAGALAGAADRGRAARALVLGGVMLVGASYGAHLFIIPYSKDYFTSSYVLLMGGVGAALSGVLWWVVDGARVAALRPLQDLGANALALYIGSELVWKMVVARWKVAGPDATAQTLLAGAKAWVGAATGPVIAAWVVVLCYVGVWMLVARALRVRGVFIRL